MSSNEHTVKLLKLLLIQELAYNNLLIPIQDKIEVYCWIHCTIIWLYS